ncbi:MAG: biotin/lipoyl-binding protein, partial [Treponema sp.]|nr:biotin/lipoyl-binding protein [Treponema sp.]
MKKLTSKSKIAIICVTSILVIILGLFITRTIIAASKKTSTVYKVREEIYENTIEIAGTVSAAQEQNLQALGIGTVLGVFVEKGDKLKKGDLIVQLDAQEQEYNLANLDYKMTATRISGSAKELELMEKQRLSLVQKIADRKVVATFDGVIADLDVSVGDSLEAKDTIGTLVNLDYLTAEVEIPET